MLLVLIILTVLFIIKDSANTARATRNNRYNSALTVARWQQNERQLKALQNKRY